VTRYTAKYTRIASGYMGQLTLYPKADDQAHRGSDFQEAYM